MKQTVFDKLTTYFNYNSFVEHETKRLEQTEFDEEDLRFKYRDYSELNLVRMARWDKTFKLSEEAKAKIDAIEAKQIWWVITELWCGDSAQILPLLANMANYSEGKIDLRIVLRDDDVSIIDAYLTNGGRSVPKLIALDAATNEELFTWGPRPAGAQKVVDETNADPDKTVEDMINALYAWYPRDKGRSTEEEVMALLSCIIHHI